MFDIAGVRVYNCGDANLGRVFFTPVHNYINKLRVKCRSVNALSGIGVSARRNCTATFCFNRMNGDAK